MCVSVCMCTCVYAYTWMCVSMCNMSVPVFKYRSVFIYFFNVWKWAGHIARLKHNRRTFLKWKWAGHIARLKDNRGQNDAQSGSQGKGRGREDDQAEDGKMT